MIRQHDLSPFQISSNHGPTRTREVFLNHPLINEEYLSSLLVLSKEQNDETFVLQLFENLQREYALFLMECRPWIENCVEAQDRKNFQNRIHKLKNNFLNLGCEEAGGHLEEIYQELKSSPPREEALHKMWTAFQDSAERSLSHLSQTLPLHH